MIEAPKTVKIDREQLLVAWGLICTREWPVSMMPDIAIVKDAIAEAVKVEPSNG